MMPFGPRQHAIPPLAALLFAATLVTAAPQKIAGYPGYSSQRNCAKLCFMYENISFDILGNQLGCLTQSSSVRQLADVSCYCRPDFEESAHQYLSQCISNPTGTLGQAPDAGCAGVGNTSVDVQTAIEIYDGYCATVRGPSTGNNSSSGGSSNSTGSGTGTSNGGSASTGGGTSSSGGGSTTDNGSSSGKSSSEDDEGGLSKSDIIAIAVAVPGFIIACVSAYYGYKAVQKRKNAHSNGSDVAVPLQSHYGHPHVQVNSGWANPWQGNHQQQYGGYHHNNGWR